MPDSTSALSTRSAISASDLAPVLQMVTDAVDSEHTRRAYIRALDDFLGWVDVQGRPSLSKALVRRYAKELQDAGASPSSINQRLSAIRKLAMEAADNELLPQTAAMAIQNVRGVRQEGQRLGNWLTQSQAQALIDAPNASTTKGLRDRAILTVLIGCGLRRAEAVHLVWQQIQQREGRWVIVDLVGKRGKIRSVPMPPWTKSAIDAWSERTRPPDGTVFRPVTKSGRIRNGPLTPQAIFYVVRQHASALGQDIAPHDLRRTYAKLAHKGGAPLEQIQLSLGHASIETTERYLGVEQNLAQAPCDFIDLRLG